MLLDKLRTAIHAEHAHFHPLLAMRVLTADLDRDVCVRDFTAVRAVPHRCIGTAVIQIRAWIGLHRVFPGCLRNRCLRNRDPTTIADGNSQLRSAYTKRTDFIGCPRNRAESAVERGDDGV